MSNFGLICDVCGREVQGYTWVNGMKFCAKCYQETFGNNTSKFIDLLNTEMYGLKISNLEHKLEEKDQRIAELEEQLKNAIVPKFKQGDKCYAIIDTMAYTDVLPVEIRGYHLLYEVWDGQDTTKQHFTRIFATKEEALVKLKDKGE